MLRAIDPTDSDGSEDLSGTMVCGPITLSLDKLSAVAVPVGVFVVVFGVVGETAGGGAPVRPCLYM